MRNFLVHEYDDVDPQRVWDTITASVPEFVEALQTPPPLAAASEVESPGVDV